MNAPLLLKILISTHLFLLYYLHTLAQDRSPNDLPNVVLIMVDDMGWSDLGCYGGEVHTPHIDRLAQEGMRFRQFYNNGKCTTTRASLLTGLYPRRDKKDTFLLRSNMLTLGEIMKMAGYRTMLSGKWHLGRDEIRHPIHRGFDRYYGLLDGASNHFDPSIQDPEYKGSRIRYFGEQTEQITSFPDTFYSTDAFTEKAIAFVKDSDQQQPFFLHICYTAPHYPLHAWPEDIQKYRGTYLMGWDSLRSMRYQRQLSMEVIDADRYKLTATDSRSYAWEEADQEFEDLRMATYAAMIHRVDSQIGNLIQVLSEEDVLDQTLILFLSDNGGCAEEPGGRNPIERHPGPKDDYVAVGPAWGWAQNAPFKRYKVWMNEGGINTPFIARWPGHIPSDTMTDEVGHIIDILPTLADIVDVPYPQIFHDQELLPLEGKSLSSVLQGKTRNPHDILCWEYAGNRAIRKGDWKLVWDKLTEHWALYDLSKDRTETTDLAEHYPQKVTELKTAWIEWAKHTGLDTNS